MPKRKSSEIAEMPSPSVSTPKQAKSIEFPLPRIQSKNTESKYLFVFDFDKSFTEQDSDHLVMLLASKKLFNKIKLNKEKLQFTDLMAYLASELFNQGVTRQQILEALPKLLIHDSIKKILEFTRSLNATVIILSDANSIYIDTILKSRNFDGFVSRVITNPAHFTREGKLIIERHTKESNPHNCPNVCALNLCKGQELMKFIEDQEFTRIFYIGDGKNDFCPSSRLNENDVTFVRTGLALESYISEKSKFDRIKAQVVYWDNADDIYKWLISNLKDHE